MIGRRSPTSQCFRAGRTWEASCERTTYGYCFTFGGPSLLSGFCMTTPLRGWTKGDIWTATVVMVTLLVGVVLIKAGHSYYVRWAQSLEYAYHVQWVTMLIDEYVIAHDGACPGNWQDLRPQYDKAVLSLGQPFSFESLQGDVEVDWNALNRISQTRSKVKPWEQAISHRGEHSGHIQ